MYFNLGFCGGSVVKNPAANLRDASSVLGLGRCPGERNDHQVPLSMGFPRQEYWSALQYFFLQLVIIVKQ